MNTGNPTNPIVQISCPIPELKEQFEKECLERVLAALELFHGNKAKSAESLGIKRTTLVEFLRKKRPDLLKLRS